MVENKQLIDQVKTLIQVGDMQYLETILNKNKITSASQYSKLIQTLQQKEDFSLAHQLCKSGDLETLSFFQRKAPKDPILSLDFQDQNGQNCLHYAVGRNHYDFVKYLLEKHTPQLKINQQTIETGESPIFFALGKIKHSQSDKARMVKLLLKDSRINIALLNSDKKACYEAYNDQFGFDEASSIIEKRHLRGDHAAEIRGSRLFYQDFSKEQRDQLLDKKIPQKDQTKMIEQHIFEKAGGDLNYEDEIREQLKRAEELQERLKSMQTQTVYDPIKYIETDYLRRHLQKKLLEFSGTALIQNIKNIYN